jgi:hypothetical protein
MIEVELIDGVILEFADDTPDAVIAQAVARYRRAAEAQGEAVGGPQAREAIAVPDTALDAPSGLADASAAPLWGNVTPSMPAAAACVSQVQPFAADDERSANEFRYRWSQPAPDENTAKDAGFYNWRPVNSRRG